MTVQDTNPSVTFFGTGAQTSFPFTFRADDVAWLTLDFVIGFNQFILNVDQDNNPGGTVEYTVAPPLAQEGTVARATPFTQQLDYTRYDAFDSESHEDALDKLTMIDQDHIYNLDIHFVDAPADGNFYVRQDNAWVLDPSGGSVAHGGLTGLGADDHPQYHDGSLAYTGDLDMGGNSIVNVNLVDGVDISIFSAAMAAHVSDGTIHFTEGSISHLNIGDIGANNHAAIDAHIADATIHFTAASIDHGSIAGLGDDDHAQYALLAGRTGGQVLFGGDAGGGDLRLQGRDDTVLGVINIDSPVVFGPYLASGQPYAFQYNPAENFTSNFIGGGLSFQGTLTFSNPTFIYESFRGSPIINTAVNPGFAAYTVLQALPQLNAGAGAGHNPLSPLILNAGAAVRNSFVGTRTVANVTGVNFASSLHGLVNGAVLNATNFTGMVVAPSWNTVAGSTINFGTIIGVDVRAPAPSLFAQSLGIERMAAFYGMQVANPGINNGFGTAPVAAIRSAILLGTNRYFLLNAGTAPSDMGSAHMYFDDNFGVAFGGNGVTNFDSWISWQSAVNKHRLFFLANNTSLYTSNPNDGRILFEVGGNLPLEFTFACDKFSIGDQTGTVGNQVGVFTAGARVVQVPGGWSDYLLTQAGNLNIGVFAMSDVAAWTINQISLDNTAGSITSLDTLVVGGMTTSNPGITVTERSALRVTGRSKLRGSVQYPPIAPSALASGDNDDWAGLLTGSPNNNGRYWARITGNAAGSNITGIDATAVQDGDSFELTNVGADNILILPEDAGSIAANRILTEDGFNHVMKPDGTATIRYDVTTSRWRVTTPAGNVAPLTGFWKFSTTTTMADPGSGTFRVNNATPASVTSIAINDISFRGGDLSPILNLLSSGDVLYMQESANGANFIKFDITGVTDNGTWYQVDGTVSNSGTLFGNNKECAITSIFA